MQRNIITFYIDWWNDWSFRFINYINITTKVSHNEQVYLEWKNLVPYFLTLRLMYLIHLSRVQSSYSHYILHTCMAAGPLNYWGGQRYWYSIWLSVPQPGYFLLSFLNMRIRTPLIIATSLTSDVTCRICLYSRLSRNLL